MSSDYDSDEWPSPTSDMGDVISDFKPEMGAFGIGGRVGLPGQRLLGLVPQNRLERAMMDPLERFRMYVDSTARNLNSSQVINISEESIEHMLVSAEKLPDVKHKNPTAYVLGFLATGEGQELTKDKFNYVISKVLPYAKERSVLPPDVIRYSRLWEKLK